MEYVEHSIKLSPGQITKLNKGQAIVISKKNLVDDGRYKIRVSPLTQKRIEAALKKGKGLKLNLGEGEHIMKKVVGAVRGVADKAKKKMIKLTDDVQDVVDGVADATKQGDGLYKFLHNKLGIKKRDAVRGLKTMGKMALRGAIGAATGALAAEGVPPEAVAPISGKLLRIGDRAIDKGTHKAGRKAARQLLTVAGDVAKEQAVNYASDMMNQMAEPELTYARPIIGGAVKRLHRGPIVDGGSIRTTHTYEGTFSPFAHPDSAERHPLVEAKNQVQGYNPLHKKSVLGELIQHKKRGGSIYPTGHMNGGSIYPA